MKKILLIISIILALFLAGCNTNQDILLDNSGNQNQKEIQNNNENIQNTENNNEENLNVSSANITVEDAVTYTADYYHLFKVRLPKVVGNTNTINELNQKILNEVLPVTYFDVVSHTILSESFDKGSTYDYKYVMKDNILVIDIYSNVPEGGSIASAPGDGLKEILYYYDIVNDKILTVSEAASKLSLSLDGLTALDGLSIINSYDELEENHYMITISNNDLKLEFFN